MVFVKTGTASSSPLTFLSLTTKVLVPVEGYYGARFPNRGPRQETLSSWAPYIPHFRQLWYLLGTPRPVNILIDFTDVTPELWYLSGVFYGYSSLWF